MYKNRVKKIQLAFLGFVFSMYSEAQCMDPENIVQPLGGLGLARPNTQPRKVLSVTFFEDAATMYDSYNAREKKIARGIIKIIASDDQDENQFKALSLLLDNGVPKDSLFSRNHLFDMILRPDVYSEEKATQAAKVLLECQKRELSLNRVGARKLIKNPQYRYQSAKMLFCPNEKNIINITHREDHKEALEVFIAVANDTDENIDHRYYAATMLYPHDINGAPEPERATAALKAYRQFLDVFIKDSLQGEGTQKEKIKKLENLYDTALFFVNRDQEKEDNQRAFNTLRSICTMYEQYPDEAFKAALALQCEQLPESLQVILPCYNHCLAPGFRNGKQPNGQYKNRFKDEWLSSDHAVQLLFDSNHNPYTMTALHFYWKKLNEVITQGSQYGSKLYPYVFDINMKLINKGQMLVIPESNGRSKGLDIVALDKLQELAKYLQAERHPSGGFKYSLEDLGQFQEKLKELFKNNPSPQALQIKLCTPEFSQSYNNALKIIESLSNR